MNSKKPPTPGYWRYMPDLTIKDEFQSFLNETQEYFDSILGNIDEIREELGYTLEIGEQWKERAKTRKEKNIIKEGIEETKKELAEKIEQILVELKKLEKKLENF